MDSRTQQEKGAPDRLTLRLDRGDRALLTRAFYAETKRRTGWVPRRERTFAHWARTMLLAAASSSLLRQPKAPAERQPGAAADGSRAAASEVSRG